MTTRAEKTDLIVEPTEDNGYEAKFLQIAEILRKLGMDPVSPKEMDPLPPSELDFIISDTTSKPQVEFSCYA